LVSGAGGAMHDFALPEELLLLEEVQFELIHDCQRAARNLLAEIVERLQRSVQFTPEIRSECVRQLELAIQLLSGEIRDPRRASRRVHRSMRAIWRLVRSNYTASFDECFPVEFVRMIVEDGNGVISDDEIPPDS